MKTVVLVGNYEGYTGPEKDIWGVNRAYVKTPRLSRLYFFDSPALMRHYGHEDFMQHAADLDIPVWATKHYEEIPLSKAFPIRAVEEHFGLPESNFTSTIAYMLAHAIYEGYEQIIIHKMLMSPGSLEYYCQKAGLDFWCGIAIGRGIALVKDRQSFLCAPHLWEPGLYGYQISDMAQEHSMILHKALAQICRTPFVFSATENCGGVAPRLSS